MVWKNSFPLKYGHVGYLCQFLGGVTAANNYYTSLMLKFPMFSDSIWFGKLRLLFFHLFSFCVSCQRQSYKPSSNNRWTPSTIQCYGRGWGCVHKTYPNQSHPMWKLSTFRACICCSCHSCMAYSISSGEVFVHSVLISTYYRTEAELYSWYSTVHMSPRRNIFIYILFKHGESWFWESLKAPGRVEHGPNLVLIYDMSYKIPDTHETIATDLHVVIYRTFHHQLARIIYVPPVSLSRK